MLNKTFHILNGDALMEQFPSEISGDKIVLRECFGDISAGFNVQNKLAEHIDDLHMPMYVRS